MQDKQSIINTIIHVLMHHQYVVRASLFGSLARGDFTDESDVDLLVEFDETRPIGFYAFSLDLALEAAVGRKVDVVQEKLMYDFIKENIAEDLELIYERSKFLD